MSPPLLGLKVLDLSSGPAGGLATMILADFGAEVRRIIDDEYDELNNMPSARMWLRGKSTIKDCDIADIDVILVSLPNSHNLHYETCAALNPTVVYCELTAMGDARLPMYEGVVAAKVGRMKQMDAILADKGPCFSAVQVATHATAMNVVSGILAALHKRRGTGCGNKVSTSLLQGLMPYDMGMSMHLQIREQRPDWTRSSRPQKRRMPTLFYQPVQCADGKWLQLGNLLDHLFENFMCIIGLEDQLTLLPEATEEVRNRILETMQTKTREEWMDIFVRDGSVAAHPYLRPEETLVDPDMTMNGHITKISEVTQLGPLAKLTKTPAEITLESKQGTGWKVTAGEKTHDAPLSDITVVEIATIIATPLGASFLRDMGARVIKVEAIGGDPLRELHYEAALRCNQGKESIGINLKSQEGQEVVHQLIRKADIVMHNFRPGVPTRLGIDYEKLTEFNPSLIYLSANGYGAAGPGAKRPSTHPIPGAAMGGAGYQAGNVPERLLNIDELRHTSQRLFLANEVNPDPNTAVVVCASVLMGLTARDQTGKGQQIFIDMFGANAYANFDAMVDFEGKPPRPSLNDDLKGPHPLYRLYRAKNSWVFLGMKRNSEWEAFCQLTNKETNWQELTENPFREHDDKLTNALSDFFAERTAEEWEYFFAQTVVACVQADKQYLSEFFQDQCNDKSSWMTRVPHPDIETYYRHRAMVSFDSADAEIEGPPTAGEHTKKLMHELGYGEERIAEYFSMGVLWQEDIS